MHKNKGRLLEDEFVFTIDGKQAKDLSHNLKHTLKEMFGLFDGEQIVHAGLIEHYQKPDIYIELNGVRKNISLKTGKSVGVGEEGLKQFLLYLRGKGLSVESQKTLLLYHFGDGTLDGSGKERMDYDLLRLKLKERIKAMNSELNDNKEFIKEFVYRCLFKGTVETNIEADFIYYGNINYGVVCSKKQIMKFIDVRDWDFMNNPHIGPIQFHPHSRYIGKKITQEERRWKVDLRWANLSADLAYIAERYDG